MTDFYYVVMGNPIAHSMSPVIQTLFAEELNNREFSYGRLLVPTDCFKETADNFFKNGGKGCNITLPCKQDAFKYADLLTDYAEKAGAVNTLKKLEDGRIQGDNTDGRGFVSDINRQGISLKDQRILILGAGGAAKGIIFPIIEQQPKSVTVANRTLSRAEDIAKAYPGIVEANDLSTCSTGFDVIINATSSSIQQALPSINDAVYENVKFAYDLMYSKDGSKTLFMQKAEELGVPKSSDGFGMLIMQAALSYSLWQDVLPNVENVFSKLRNMT